MHQRSARDAARLFVVRQRDVVGDNHHLDFQAVAFGFLRRQAEVEAVARVVFNNQQAATVARYRHNGVEYRIYTWRGKQVAAHRRRQHAFADEPGMRGFMARAAARNHRYPAFIPVAARDNPNRRVDIKPHQIAVRRG